MNLVKQTIKEIKNKSDDISLRIISTKTIIDKFINESSDLFNFVTDEFSLFSEGTNIDFIIPVGYEKILPVGNYYFWDDDWCDMDNLVIQKHYKDDFIDKLLFKFFNFNFDCIYNNYHNKPNTKFIDGIKSSCIFSGNIESWKSFIEKYKNSNNIYIKQLILYIENKLRSLNKY